MRVFFNYKSQITKGKLQMFFLKAVASSIEHLDLNIVINHHRRVIRKYLVTINHR